MFSTRLALLILCVSGPSHAAGEINHLESHPARTPDGGMHVVVEIPAGTNAKWEVDPDGRLVWELENGEPRIVAYLPYPVNYGMVPRTLQDERTGGDGDPLDVFVLGPALARGSVVATTAIGVIRMLDGGERDDKLLAVSPEGPLRGLRSLNQLEEQFPGALRILRIWLENYKGRDIVRVEAILGAEAAESALDAASAAFSRAAAE